MTTYAMRYLEGGWVVEKRVEGGADTVLATFDTSEAATAMLSMLISSREVINGAQVEFNKFVVGRT